MEESKPRKYFKARKAGKSKTESAIVAGYAPETAKTHITQIENTKEFQKLEKRYKDTLLDTMKDGEKSGMQVIADEHKKIIMQDDEMGAKLAAVKLAIERAEPDGVPEEKEEKVIVILRDN